MNLKLERPIACIDLETTGISITKDRIVEIAIVKVHPDGTRETKVRRVNPLIPIPAEASEVHGILDKDVADEASFKEIGNEIKQFIENCDLCGYNSNRFDFALLTEEFLRSGIDVDFKSRKQVDVHQIFVKQEPRNLTAAYKFYCDKDLVGAHGALADTEATFEILLAQIDRYDIGDDVHSLHNLSKGDDVLDYARRIKILNDVAVFNFGKHKDKSVIEVLQKEPQYYDWIMRSDFAQDTKNVLSKIFNQFMLNKT